MQRSPVSKRKKGWGKARKRKEGRRKGGKEERKKGGRKEEKHRNQVKRTLSKDLTAI